MRKGIPVGGIPGILVLKSVCFLLNGIDALKDIQPINLFVMCQAEYKFVHYPISPNRATDEIQFSIFRIIEDEVVKVKLAQVSASNTSSDLDSVNFDIERYMGNATYCWDVVYIGLLHHGGHCLLDRSISKFIIGMLFPNFLEIEVGSLQVLFQKT